jgi:glycosyltransferase involved in cell wall biosynthesis
MATQHQSRPEDGSSRSADEAAAQLAIYLPDLSGGGAEKLHVNLTPHLAARGFAPRFLLDQARGALLDTVADDCPIDVLNAHRQIAALPRLVRHLRARPPAALIANMEHMAVMAAGARALSGARTRLIITQHNTYSEQLRRTSWKWRALPPFYRRALLSADAIIAVSAGVADDLAAVARIPRERIDVIYNGVVGDDLDARAAGEPSHPWYGETTPVIVAMGRMVPQKDFATLIRAMADPATPREARLIILGEGPQRVELEALVTDLGLRERVAMPGFVGEPLPWLRRADLFVLSSRFEGFGNVIAEALACGTPVVSTDCPHGPAEILDRGRFGRLAPVGDPAALARAIALSLGETPQRDELRARGRSFNMAVCADAYASVVRRVLAA